MWLVLFIAAIPPLTNEQVARVSGAADGADYHDEAFLALVENARQWTEGLGDAPIRLNPNLQAMTQDPAAFRGELCRASGTLQQMTRLAPPYQDVNEWFVQTSDGQAVIAYVVGMDQSSRFIELQVVELDARFYKRMELTSRDGVKRNYPALVGAFPRSSTPPLQGVSRSSVIAGLVVLMAVIFVGVLLWARKSGGGRRGRLGVQNSGSSFAPGVWSVDDDAPLPDDPGQALAELKRRAEAPNQES